MKDAANFLLHTDGHKNEPGIFGIQNVDESCVFTHTSMYLDIFSVGSIFRNTYKCILYTIGSLPVITAEVNCQHRGQALR